MAEISRRAEVGMATLYRNFSNRRELLEALSMDEVDAVCRAAATIDGANPGAAFTAWLPRFFTYFTSKATSPPSCSSTQTQTTPCSGRVALG